MHLHSLMHDTLSSIYSLLPLDSGGRSARQGFTYQDHVGAAFCIELLEATTIQEIWFENLDDITLIHKEIDETIVEFIQVKAHHPTSRWSVASLTNKDDGGSIFEKSLNQCRCKEPVKIRIVTCYDVNDDLKILTNFPNSLVRSTETEKIDKLEKEIAKRLEPSLTSPNGLSIRNWIERCYWDKRPDSNEAIESCNKIALEKVLKVKKISLQPEYRDELYEQILNRVMQASTDDISKNPNCFCLSKDKFEKWFYDRIADFQLKNRGINALESKMEEAGFDNEVIITAKELKWAFLEESLNNDFCEPKDLRLMQNEILARIHFLKTQRYKNAITLDGIEFHDLCMDNIEAILKSDILKWKEIPTHMAHGYFYEITDRCLIRFVKK